MKNHNPGKSEPFTLGFYAIALGHPINVIYRYGQQSYDFKNGMMFFMAPNQIIGIETSEAFSISPGWMILIHPDFLWHTALAQKIKTFDFFEYSINEALFLSNKEEVVMQSIIQTMKLEYDSNTDKFSKQITKVLIKQILVKRVVIMCGICVS